MSTVGPFIMDMSDQEYWSHMEKCDRLAIALSRIIDLLMHHIFEGKAESPQVWEELFVVLNQAILIKEYLTRNCANLLTIAEDLVCMVIEWQRDLERKVN